MIVVACLLLAGAEADGVSVRVEGAGEGEMSGEGWPEVDAGASIFGLPGRRHG